MALAPKTGKQRECAMPEQVITVDSKLFVGRVEEQKQFRSALTELLNPPPREVLPYICLLYGEGGSGKTTLAKRFRDIALTEALFEQEYKVLWIDWEDERKKFPDLQVRRQQINPEAVFRVIHAAAVREKWGRQFAAYRKAIKIRDEASKKVAEAITTDNDWDELAILRSIGVDALAKIVRSKIPVIGDAGEEIVEAFLDAGVRVGTEQAVKIRRVIENQLRVHLKSDHFDYFLNPHEQLALALARGLDRVAKKQRLLVILDTYEIIDRTDIWLRAVIRAAGPKVIWVICGRNDLVQSRRFGTEYFKGYADDSPRRMLSYKMLPLSIEDIHTFFEMSVPERPLTKDQIESISRVTRGIPLAVKEAVDIWKAGAELKEIIGDINETSGANLIVQKITDRYMQHVVAEEDKQGLFALALADGDVDLLRSMLRPDDDAPFDLEELLSRLERDYASVHASRARLHDNPAIFFREYLQAEVRRTSDRVRNLNNRAVVHLQNRLMEIESELPRTEDRCQDDSWFKNVLFLTHFLFWTDENDAWHWIIPRFVEGLAYNPYLQDGLVQIVTDWRGLSVNTEKLLRVLERATEDRNSLIRVLTQLAERGWLEGEGAEERKAILEVFRGDQLIAKGNHQDALESFQKAEAGMPPDGEMLKNRLVDAYELLSRRLIWQNDRYQPVYDPTAEKILSRILAWQPERAYAWYLAGVNQGAAHRYDRAVEALQKAIELNPQHVAANNAMGSIFSVLNRNEEAQEYFNKALSLDPNSAISHAGLGNVLIALDQPEKALGAFERAI
jgi:tetratricopeptide (TPR) repeat protein